MSGSTLTPIVAAAHDYRVAAVELPASTRLVADHARAVVVLAGVAGIAGSAGQAAAHGAEVLVLAEGTGIPLEVLEDLRATVRIPVVVARPRLRADVTAGLGAAPDVRAVVVEAAAAPEEATAVLRDALGWARVFSGAPLRTVALSHTGEASLTLLDAAGVGVTLLTTETRGAALVRAQTVGAARIEVTIDDGAGRQRVTWTTEDGVLERPTRVEGLARLALRRAVAVAVGGPAPTDLDDLIEDARLAQAIRAARDA